MVCDTVATAWAVPKLFLDYVWKLDNISIMPDTRAYSVTPRTLCIRHANGTRQVLFFTRPKDENNTWGFLIASSFKCKGGKWTRAYEHPQEWEDAA